MRKLLVVFLAAVAVLGLAGCGGGSSAKSKSKSERGSALVGLAEISFQEKNYADAVRSATLAVDRGGGVKARVLLGDAHFRLSHYKEAAQAYGDALKLDPNNASAKTGLALATKRM